MIIDSTLREGDQCYGVHFTAQQKQNLLEGLGRLGVDEIELGVQGHADLEQLLLQARRLAPRSAHSVWCRAREQDVRQAAALGCRLNMGLPVSRAHLLERLGLEPAQAPLLAARMTALAREAGCSYVSLGLEDVSRADSNLPLDTAAAALEAGAVRIRLSDSVGLLEPARMQALVRRFRQVLEPRFPGFQLAVHCHNDFGMATANAVAALGAGADYADACLLGAGERAGITHTEELAAWLVLREERGGYDLTVLKELCTLAARAARLPLSRLHPVVGGDAFATESGLHVHAMTKDPALFEPFDPARVAGERRLSLGVKSGRGAVRAGLERLGIMVEEGELQRLVAACRQRAAALGRPLDDDDLRALASRSGCSGPEAQALELQERGGQAGRRAAKQRSQPWRLAQGASSETDCRRLFLRSVAARPL